MEDRGPECGSSPDGAVRPLVGETDIHAYADGTLDARRRAEVEAYLATHPAEAARVAAYRAQNRALRALGALLDDALGPAPEALQRLAARVAARLADRSADGKRSHDRG